MLGDQRLGLEPDPRLHVAPLGVHRIQFGGHGAGTVAILGQQQLEPRVGPVQAAGGVQPRAEAEPDRLLVDRARVHARDVHQRPQTDLARVRQPPQPGADQPPVLSEQRHHVGHRGQGDQVQVLVGQRGVLPRRLEQRPRELVRHARRAQVRARVAVQPRVDERSLGQHAVRTRRVMVGDDDIHPERARRRDLLDRGHRAVDRDQQLRAAGRQPLDRAAGEPVSVVDPRGQVPVDVRAQRAQRSHQDRRRADAVHVVVAVHGDPRAQVAEDPGGGGIQTRPRRERMRIAGGQERTRRLRLSQPPPHEHLRQHVRAAEVLRQPGGSRKFVRGDGQARVHDLPEARRVGGRNRGTMDRMAPLDDAVRDLYSDLEIDGRVLDMGEPSAGHFDVAPDELVTGDPERFEATSFDAVLSRNRIDGETFGDAARVLRPGGLFVVTFAGSVRRRRPGADRPRLLREDAGVRPGRERPTSVAHRHGRPALGGLGETQLVSARALGRRAGAHRSTR